MTEIKGNGTWLAGRRRAVIIVSVVIAVIAAMELIPLVLSSNNVGIADLVLLAIPGALALNILTGYAGQVSLGNAAFLAIGAFTAVFTQQNLHLGMWVGTLLAALVAGLLGLLVGAPSLRFRGFYLVLTTLALQVIVVYALQEVQTKYSGGVGFSLNPQYLFNFALSSSDRWYVFLLPLTALIIVLCRNLVRSNTGRAWVGVRDRDIAVAISGVNVSREKLKVFVFTSALIGFAGALTAYFTGFVSYDTYTLSLSIEYVVMIVVGGMGTISGAILGAAFVIVLPQVISALANLLPTTSSFYQTIQNSEYFIQYAIYGLVIIAIIILEPRGLAAIPSRCVAYVRRRRQPRPLVNVRSVGADGQTPSDTPSSPKQIPLDGRVKSDPGRPVGEAILEIRGLEVVYESIQEVVHGIDLEVRSGELVAVLGANGAGKTSLLRAVSGFSKVEKGTIPRGEIWYRGERIDSRAPDKIARMGIVQAPERDKVFRTMTVSQNLKLASSISGATKTDLDEVLELFPQLRNRMDSMAALLSGGERQMLALGVALMMKPKLLLIDELSLGLAPSIIKSLYGTIDTIRQHTSISVLVVEQDATAALAMADYVYILEQGRIVLEGTSQVISEDMSSLGAYFGIEDIELGDASQGATPKAKVSAPSARTS